MPAPSFTVLICAYTEQRWDDLVLAVASAQAQTVPPLEVVVVVDHCPELLERVSREISGVVVTSNRQTRGLSGARNSGTAIARGDIVAFLDDDAAAEPDWLEHLLAGYADPLVLGVGGSIEPLWSAGRPAAFPEEFHWVVGCTYRGMPEAASPVRNLIGANMSFRREALLAVGGFRADLGRVGTRPVGCEETELCLRVHERWPEAVLLYEPRARVRHRVPESRTTWKYFRDRCYAEGLSKARVSALAGARRGLASERSYALRTLPKGVARGVADAISRGDPAGWGRAAAIGAGLTFTTAGYMIGKSFGPVAAPGTRGGAQPAGKENTLKDVISQASVNGYSPPTDQSGRWLEFDFHGRAAVRVAKDAPTATLLADMFAPFRAKGLGRYDLTITADFEGMSDACHAEHTYRFTDSALHVAAMNVQIVMDGDEIRLHGTRELLTSALPLLDWIVTKRDVGMFHAATMAYKGHGVAMPAWGGVGKTSTMAKFLRLEGAAFMGDDWAFLSGDGQQLAYAKPMFIKPHHRPIYPHLFAAKRKPLVPKKLSRPVGELTTLVHPLVTQYPKLAGFTRRWSPEHMMVTPRQAFPQADHATAAPLALAIFVERFDGNHVVLEPRSTSWMVARMVGNFHAELARHSRDVITALGATGLVPIERIHAEKAAIFERALADKPCFSLRVPAAMSADQASDVIVDYLREVLALSGIE